MSLLLCLLMPGSHQVKVNFLSTWLQTFFPIEIAFDWSEIFTFAPIEAVSFSQSTRFYVNKVYDFAPTLRFRLVLELSRLFSFRCRFRK